jgi:hypothetical protein
MRPGVSLTEQRRSSRRRQFAGIRRTLPDDPTFAAGGQARGVHAMIGTTRRASIDLSRSVPGPKVRVARMEPSPFALVSLALALLLSGAGERAASLRPVAWRRDRSSRR